MEKNLVKTFNTKDGKFRVKIYRDENAENPRDMTDEPLHCEDWSRNCTIMGKQDRETQSASARDLIAYLLSRYGKREEIISMLIENGKHMTDGKSKCNNALVYDRSMRCWVLKEYVKWYGEEEFDWKDAEFCECKREDIDIETLLEDCLDSTIDEFCDAKFWTDGVKMASYSFGYYGGISFDNDFSTDSEGICWLEKEEFLKYSGCKEEYWNAKTLREIEFLIEEIEAWTADEVYGFVVEEKHGYRIHKESIDHDEEPQDYEEVEWEETGSCWGYYGELDKNLKWILGEAGYKMEELEEVS